MSTTAVAISLHMAAGNPSSAIALTIRRAHSIICQFATHARGASARSLP